MDYEAAQFASYAIRHAILKSCMHILQIPELKLIVNLNLTLTITVTLILTLMSYAAQLASCAALQHNQVEWFALDIISHSGIIHRTAKILVVYCKILGCTL